MRRRIDLSGFLGELAACCEEIHIAIQYANSLLESANIPREIMMEIKGSANRCKVMRQKYESVLNDNLFDEKTEDTIRQAAESYDDDMAYLYGFLTRLDLYLIEYGDGPVLHKRGHFSPSPLEV